MRHARHIVPTIVVIALVFAQVLVPGCAKTESGSHAGHDEGAKPAATIYICPMHPQITSDKPGQCPICGMNLVPRAQEGGGPKAEVGAPAAAKKTMYRSTMNPGEVSDKPGKDSMGMEMVPFETGAEPVGTFRGRASVTITPEHRKHMNLATSTVEIRELRRDIRAPARIVPDETKLYRVTTKFEGYVEKLFVNVTGQAVKKGEPLLSIFSPELVASQQELLSALASAAQLSKSPYAAVSQGGKDLVEASRRRLKLWDISDAQIEKIEKTGVVEKALTLYATAGGFVSEKAVLAGQKVMPGDSLLVIADLSTVWAEADVYESDLPYIKVGMPVSLSFSYWPGKTFEGKVSFINPFLDPESRTIKARLTIPNPGVKLKPGMYGDASLSYEIGERAAVPESAVMRTGTRDFVFVDSGEKLSPVEVKVGARSGDYFEVVSGVKPGDKVVTSANFLVDSESALKAALQAVTGK
ncbi:MAG: efflux RND transporter periplasmic adaptor subunit [Deltaproteobacteria bacterium]|nr:efflux RND transporter periplasmic adaptor subunit [Deltaproteobacteria bacterium]